MHKTVAQLGGQSCQGGGSLKKALAASWLDPMAKKKTKMVTVSALPKVCMVFLLICPRFYLISKKVATLLKQLMIYILFFMKFQPSLSPFAPQQKAE
jgi:hypothetical protein